MNQIAGEICFAKNRPKQRQVGSRFLATLLTSGAQEKLESLRAKMRAQSKDYTAAKRTVIAVDVREMQPKRRKGSTPAPRTSTLPPLVPC